ncbi:DUF3265 domain-containing protein, partial [Vibrio parahaemolyticus]|nr:DUF3265 domain-containing protein [Vibrio parahaemolyticus]
MRQKRKVRQRQTKNLTICLRGIRNAWHFCYALIFVFKVVCSN